MATMTLPKEIKEILHNGQIFTVFVNLYFRWQDEKKYEDFKDYVDVMAGCLPVGSKVLGGTKRPLGIKFKYNNQTFHLMFKVKNSMGRLAVGIIKN